jgi:Uncharacterized protein conserved in archaea
MNKRIFIFVAIFLVSVYSLVMFASADAGGYLVEPATPDMIDGTSHDLERIQVWQLPPRVLAIYAALLVFPLLVFPLELIFLLKIFACLGYRKIAQKNVLDNTSRDRIYRYIVQTPGTDFTEISKKTGVSENSLRYHLTVLKCMNKVTMLESSRNTRYFENSSRYSVMEKKVLKYLHTKSTRILLQLLIGNPNLTRIQIEGAVRISGPGVTWQMQRLADDGILEIRKAGRNARYEINNEARLYLEKYLLQNQLNTPKKNEVTGSSSDRTVL